MSEDNMSKLKISEDSEDSEDRNIEAEICHYCYMAYKFHYTPVNTARTINEIWGEGSIDEIRVSHMFEDFRRRAEWIETVRKRKN